MQINPDFNIGVFTIRSYAPKEINVYTPLTEEEILANMDSPHHEPIQHTKTLDKPFIITNNQLVEDWQVAGVTAINRDNLKQLIDLNVEIIIIGTGKTIIFPDPRDTVFVQQNGVGLEVMSTEAACRTYNFLVSDGRKVAAALFMIEN